jgi:hypothetical protein
MMIYLASINILDILRDRGVISKSAYANVLLYLTILRLTRFLIDLGMHALFVALLAFFIKSKKEKKGSNSKFFTGKGKCVMGGIIFLFVLSLSHSVLLLYEALLLQFKFGESLVAVDVFNFWIQIVIHWKDALISGGLAYLYYSQGRKVNALDDLHVSLQLDDDVP